MTANPCPSSVSSLRAQSQSICQLGTWRNGKSQWCSPQKWQPPFPIPMSPDFPALRDRPAVRPVESTKTKGLGRANSRANQAFERRGKSALKGQARGVETRGKSMHTYASPHTRGHLWWSSSSGGFGRRGVCVYFYQR